MFQLKTNQYLESEKKVNAFTVFPVKIEIQYNSKLDKLLTDLFSNPSWFDRKTAAQKLGYMRNPDALPGLLEVLPTDPFWMVRCAIIQALERIGDPRAIPALREIEKRDGFQVVRSYAATAIERLSFV